MSPILAESLRVRAGPLEQSIATYVEETVEQVVDTEQFRTAWVSANRAAHAQMIGLLNGQGSQALEVEQGTVKVNLAGVIALVKQELVAQGFGPAQLIPEISAELAVFESPELVRLQRYVRIADAWSTWLPFLALVTLLGAVVLSRRRGLARVLIALGISLAAYATLAGLDYLREASLAEIGVREYGTAAGVVVFDALVFELRDVLRFTAVAGLVVAALSWIVSVTTAAWPSRPARQP